VIYFVAVEAESAKEFLREVMSDPVPVWVNIAISMGKQQASARN
jgi:hypothetical protein